ncbi:[FeFe] hydrogenase H-cluster radical SAM maturase HydE [Pyramidobacter sp. YE332]|uniref:[FeFe] hydrogenase H-cluster radical SAM maturase HydE n=1 Tax=unclassified Pyramidobacter TaxID=2632171 RepID=UPI00098F5D8F|nr:MULTISPECIES: [FeFe] hydrogenase H-cluster radical SAM maturase HydE [unclassified Pyramidobacter]OON86906.1 [FeFe] hydrogenase H-cluster radical SAM maturase HydE [Pyramidobacter sp. C12-8]WOL39646.1 [FeFe] hydrogenase H-cluster radical SAM maturase HydE [Pyramidobacter sp. YE332]
MDDKIRTLAAHLIAEHDLPPRDLQTLLENNSPELRRTLAGAAQALCRAYYGDEVYVRGLIEFTNECRNDCYYCGIRRGNGAVRRYRLGEEEILGCCRQGYDWGFRTFVLQGGEDPQYPPERIASLVASVRREFPDCAVTLSVGECSDEAYRMFFEAGAERYLLRHETACDGHYRMLHPLRQRPENRRRCLWTLKRLGYQVGAGFMVGSPGQRPAHLAADFQFMKELQPQMIGVGPFIPQRDTPFGHAPAGTLELTLLCLSLLRLFFPKALIPATTALGTIAADGRELGILAGANVVMPNLSPPAVRRDYALYDRKICTGEEAAEGRGVLALRMKNIGRRLAVGRGDAYGFPPRCKKS